MYINEHIGRLRGGFRNDPRRLGRPVCRRFHAGEFLPRIRPLPFDLDESTTTGREVIARSLAYRSVTVRTSLEGVCDIEVMPPTLVDLCNELTREAAE